MQYRLVQRRGNSEVCSIGQQMYARLDRQLVKLLPVRCYRTIIYNDYNVAIFTYGGKVI